MAAEISVSSYKMTRLVINSKFTDQVIGKNGDAYIFKECRCDMKSKSFSVIFRHDWLLKTIKN